MTKPKFRSINEAARELGKPKNNKLLRALIAKHQIPTARVGPCRMLDEDGFALLRAKVEEWDNRPRLKERATA